MTIRKTLTAAVLMLVACLSAFAQMPGSEPVRWRLQYKISPTDTTSCTIIIKALVEDGWHLYGTTLPDGGPKPTSFDFSGCTGIKLTGKLTPSKKPVEADDPMFGMKLNWWGSNVDFSIPVKITDPNTARLSVKINYMTCDGNSCRPPKTETLSAPLKFKLKKRK